MISLYHDALTFSCFWTGKAVLEPRVFQQPGRVREQELQSGGVGGRGGADRWGKEWRGAAGGGLSPAEGKGGMDRQGFAEIVKGLLMGLMASAGKLIQLEKLSNFRFGAGLS